MEEPGADETVELDRSAPDDGSAEGDEESAGWVFEAFAKEEYRFRYATAPVVAPSVLDTNISSGEYLRRGADHDLHLYLSGSARDLKDRFWINASFGLFADIDGFTSSGDPTALSSVNENGSSIASLYPSTPAALRFDMYSLFGEYHSDGVPALIRIGRQVSEHGRDVTFDGLAMDFRAVKSYLTLFAFGGRSVHFFETDDSLYEDWLASAGAQIRPLDLLKFELEYRFNAEDIPTDDALLGGAAGSETETVVNHLYSLTTWFHLDDLFYLKAYFRGIGATPADAGGAAQLHFAPVEMGLDLKGDAQLTTFREINELDDAFYAVLGESLPHVRLNADLWKSFTTRAGIYTLHGGWAARMLTKDSPAAFNRDYGRAYLSFDAADIGVEGPFLSAIAEFYYTHADSERFVTAGGSAGYDANKVRAELGTYYQWVKYKYYSDIQEIEDVRTYFAEIRFRPLKWLTIRAKYELEQFDRLIHTAVLSLSQAY